PRGAVHRERLWALADRGSRRADDAVPGREARRAHRAGPTWPAAVAVLPGGRRGRAGTHSQLLQRGRHRVVELEPLVRGRKALADVPGRRIGQALLRSAAERRLGDVAHDHHRGSGGSRPPRAAELVLPGRGDGGARPPARRVRVPRVLDLELGQGVRRFPAIVMPGKVRRIVTGVNHAGRSCILSDTLLPKADVAPGAPVLVGLWTTDASPASNQGT